MNTTFPGFLRAQPDGVLHSIKLQPRLLPETRIGDLVVFGGAGAYCSSMAAKNYNSFPEAAEVMISGNGSVELIRKRQTLDQILQNEVMPAFLKGRAK